MSGWVRTLRTLHTNQGVPIEPSLQRAAIFGLLPRNRESTVLDVGETVRLCYLHFDCKVWIRFLPFPCECLFTLLSFGRGIRTHSLSVLILHIHPLKLVTGSFIGKLVCVCLVQIDYRKIRLAAASYRGTILGTPGYIGRFHSGRHRLAEFISLCHVTCHIDPLVYILSWITFCFYSFSIFPILTLYCVSFRI